MSKPTRIDQYLFLNIVRQSYEAQKAWNIYIDKYKNQSEKERSAYERFSRNTKRDIISENDSFDEKNKKVLELWCDMSDEEQIKYINETRRLDSLFSDVDTFLRMFQHNV